MGVRGHGCSCGLGLEEPQGGPVRLMGMAPLCITGLQPQGMVLLGHACLRVPMGCEDVGERLVQQVDFIQFTAFIFYCILVCVVPHHFLNFASMFI